MVVMVVVLVVVVEEKYFSAKAVRYSQFKIYLKYNVFNIFIVLMLSVNIMLTPKYKVNELILYTLLLFSV